MLLGLQGFTPYFTWTQWNEKKGQRELGLWKCMHFFSTGLKEKHPSLEFKKRNV